MKTIYIFDHTLLSSSQNEKRFLAKVVEKLETRILCSTPSYNLEVTVDGISQSTGEHTKVPCSGYT
jgi:hypothetical protein